MAKKISVRAFGTLMLFHVPNDADMDGLVINSFRSRKDIQRQIDDYLRKQGYNPDDHYNW